MKFLIITLETLVASFYDLKTSLGETKNSAEDWNTSQLLTQVINNLSTRLELEGKNFMSFWRFCENFLVEAPDAHFV